MSNKIVEPFRKLTYKVGMCITCQNQSECPAWAKLTKGQKVFMTIGNQARNILEDCPLPVYEETEYE